MICDRNISLEDLAKITDTDGKRVYSDELLEDLRNGNHACLHSLTPEQRENIFFMEPILYAVKNSPDLGTYIVYKYYGKNLQEDLGLLIEVVLDDPSIIEGTPISKNKEFMLDIVELKPSVIQYVDNSLKTDVEFIEELHEIQDKGVEASIALLENPELAHDQEFMKEAIKEDAKFLEFASEELKNNYEFMKDIIKQNYATVEYVIEKRDDFGLEGIKGAKEATREMTVEDYMAILDDMSESSDDNRYNKVRQKVIEKGSNDPKVVRWITAMAAQSDRISTDNFQKVFDNAILTMIKTQKDLTEDGKIKVSVDNMQEFITPHILNKLKDKAIEQGLEIDSDLEVKIEEYTEFFNNYREKLQEQKRANRNKDTAEKAEQEKPEDVESKEEPIEEQEKSLIPQEIEGLTLDLKTSDLNYQAGVVRGTIERDQSEQQQEVPTI